MEACLLLHHLFKNTQQNRILRMRTFLCLIVAYCQTHFNFFHSMVLNKLAAKIDPTRSGLTRDVFLRYPVAITDQYLYAMIFSIASIECF
jgi:hypothetical protein